MQNIPKKYTSVSSCKAKQNDFWWPSTYFPALAYNSKQRFNQVDIFMVLVSVCWGEGDESRLTSWRARGVLSCLGRCSSSPRTIQLAIIVSSTMYSNGVDLSQGTSSWLTFYNSSAMVFEDQSENGIQTSCKSENCFSDPLGEGQQKRNCVLVQVCSVLIKVTNSGHFEKQQSLGHTHNMWNRGCTHCLGMVKMGDCYLILLSQYTVVLMGIQVSHANTSRHMATVGHVKLQSITRMIFTRSKTRYSGWAE